MNISYQPLWNTLKERGMRKRICEALNCGILDVIELEQNENNQI